VLDNAKLNLAWTKVYSPIDGIAGVSNSQIGDLVGTGTKMTVVSQVNPIWAYFNISESAYLANAEKIARIVREGGSRPTTPITYIQANGEVYPQTGHLISINRQVSTGTGTVQLIAEFPNKDALLRPGGFGSVRIQTSENKNALLVPQPAVIEVQSQYQVIVVTPENRAMSYQGRRASGTKLDRHRRPEAGREGGSRRHPEAAARSRLEPRIC